MNHQHSAAQPRHAVFLDRDGTLVRDSGFVHRVEDLELLDGAVEGLRRMAALGLRLVIATNQSGVARGRFSEAQMQAFNDALCLRLAAEGIEILAVYACVFHPTEGLGRYRRDSPLRKPRPGMLLAAAAEHGLELAGSFTVGDRLSDVAAGRAAGCRTVLLRSRLETAGDCPDFAESSGQNGTVSFSQAVLKHPLTSPPSELAVDLRPDFVAVDLVEAAAHIEHAQESPENGTGVASRLSESRPLVVQQHRPRGQRP